MSSRFLISKCTLAEAKSIVRALHRHAGGVLIAQESVQAVERSSGRIVGTGILGRPLHQTFCDGLTLEVCRTATDGTEHACSAILGSLCRAARRRGALRVITYTRSTESGASLRAAGFRLDLNRHRRWVVSNQSWEPTLVPTPPRSWISKSRPGRLDAIGAPRFRWFKVLHEGMTEEGAIALGYAAGSVMASVDTYPFNVDTELSLRSAWREAYDCSLGARSSA